MSEKTDRDAADDVARTYPELLAKLRSQVGFLERSSDAFDAGNEDEGERLALTARLLLHDTSHSHSLLGQLRVKTDLGYTDTSIQVENEDQDLGGGLHITTATKHAGLVGLRASAGGSWTYAPILQPDSESGRENPPATFDQWWRRPFLKDSADRPITRASVVLNVANKDGGAHVAKAIPEAFHSLTSGATLGFQTGADEDSFSDIPGIVMATMRQIAYELLESMNRLPNFILGSPLAESAELTDAERGGIPRNAGCPCGSGKKFKICHGS